MNDRARLLLLTIEDALDRERAHAVQALNANTEAREALEELRTLIGG